MSNQKKKSPQAISYSSLHEKLGEANRHIRHYKDELAILRADYAAMHEAKCHDFNENICLRVELTTVKFQKACLAYTVIGLVCFLLVVWYKCVYNS